MKKKRILHPDTLIDSSYRNHTISVQEFKASSAFVAVILSLLTGKLSIFFVFEKPIVDTYSGLP